MEAVLIARFKTKREANRISRLIEQLSKPVRSITGTNLEDMYLGEMIEEGMREKRDHRYCWSPDQQSSTLNKLQLFHMCN